MQRKTYFEERPWGSFKRFALNQECTVKIIEVKQGQKNSLQYHNKRSELWVALDPSLKVVVGEKTISFKKGQEAFIPRKTKHRLIGGKKSARVLEISFGHFDESDEIRLEDSYGRA